MGRCSYTWEEWDEEKHEHGEKCCQKETWKGSDEFCIFHDPSLEKDVDLFKEMLEEQIQSETVRHNFIGYHFPEKWDFSGKEFKIDANFGEATFHNVVFGEATFQDAYFRGATFHNADFSKATFQGNADFRGATFQDAYFRGATFQDAYFRGATFQDAEFMGATFQDAYFRGATFQDANFMGATFHNAEFGGATFHNADFSKATFHNADFIEATFQGTAYFIEATFQDVYFIEATFQDANFEGATFQDANFEGATFHNADFSKATFHNADFSKATFHNADFQNATFQDANFRNTIFQNAGFWDATFTGTLYLEKATFQTTANFQNATFQDVYFEGATFHNAYFQNATFQGTAYFQNATFQGTAYFQNATFQDVYFEGATFQDVYFEGATFQKKIELALKDNKKINLRSSEFLFRGQVTADLTKCLFHRSIIENVAFIDCIWPKNYIVFEERHKNDKEINLSFAQLETIYRDLKQNMQNHGDYIRAGELYYREMEMRRKGTSKKEISRWWLEFYRFLAGYGEKPYLVVRNSFLVILLAAILFFFCGVARVGTELPLQENPDIIQYSIHSLNLNVETLKDFGYCLYYSIVTFTTLGYGDIHPLGYSHVLASAEALTGAFFMALFVVVFARKMMR